MLLDQHGGERDQNPDYGEDYPPEPADRVRVNSSLVTAPVPFPCGSDDRKAVEYVDAGCQVCRSVCHVEQGNHVCEHIFLRHGFRPQQVNIRKNNGDDDENSHSDGQHCAESVIGFLIFHEKENREAEHVGKPEYVGNDEYR